MNQKRKIVSPIKKVNNKVAPQEMQYVENEEHVEEYAEEYADVEVEQPQQQFKDFKEYLNVFEFSCILPGSGKRIRYKPMTVKALKSMLTQEGDISSAQAFTEMFDKLFDHCVLNENFDPINLFIYDRYVLLFEIRKHTKGETSEFTMTCPECKGQSIQKINFEDIEILPVPDNVDYVVSLTDELSVTMKYLTRKDELYVFEIANEECKGMGATEKETDTVVWMLAASIDDIITPQGPQPGVTIYDKKYLLENLPQPLYRKIQTWHEENKFGPNMTVKVKCPHCKNEAEQDVTDLDFF
jgi:hypothetical protein